LPWSAGFFDVSDEQAKVVVVGEGYEDHVLLSLDGTSEKERKATGGPG
jgi:hypothetical protein